MKPEQSVERCYPIPGQTWPLELRWLYDLGTRSRSHVEIGTYCGRSLLATASGMTSGASVLAVDNEAMTLPIGERWVQAVRAATMDVIRETAGIVPRLLTIGSLDAARLCWTEGRRFDSIFIDASHHYAETLADIQAWMPMLVPGGVICGHDYWPVHTGVMDAVNEQFNSRFEIVPGTRIWVATT